MAQTVAAHRKFITPLLPEKWRFFQSVPDVQQLPPGIDLPRTRPTTTRESP